MLNSSIEFTLIIEQDLCLPFSKVQISWSISNFTFSACRKPLKENMVIFFPANVPFKYKIATFQAFIRRSYIMFSDNQINRKSIKMLSQSIVLSFNIFARLCDNVIPLFHHTSVLLTICISPIEVSFISLLYIRIVTDSAGIRCKI